MESCEWKWKLDHDRMKGGSVIWHQNRRSCGNLPLHPLSSFTALCFSAFQARPGENVSTDMPPLLMPSEIMPLEMNILKQPPPPRPPTTPALHPCSNYPSEKKTECLTWPLRGPSPPTRDSTQQLSKVRACKMWQWKAAAASLGLARAPWFGGPGLESQLGMTQSRLQEPWLLCSPHTHLHNPQCCFSTALLSARIHSCPTEPAELQESTATYGIYGNLKILTSAIVLHTKYSVNCVQPTPTDFSGGTFFFFFFFKCRLIAFPGRTVVYLSLISFLFFLSVSPFAVFFSFFPKGKTEESGGAQTKAGEFDPPWPSKCQLLYSPAHRKLQ